MVKVKVEAEDAVLPLRGGLSGTIPSQSVSHGHDMYWTQSSRALWNEHSTFTWQEGQQDLDSIVSDYSEYSPPPSTQAPTRLLQTMPRQCTPSTSGLAVAHTRDDSSPRFSAGRDARLTKLAIRQKVRAELLAQRTKQKTTGTLYALSESHYGMVKIGWTSGQTHETRLNHIAKQQKVHIIDSRTVINIPVEVGRMLEKIVHTDLARHRMTLTVPNNNTARGHSTHGEWFNVSLTVAHNTMLFWWTVLKRYRLGPGVPPPRALMDILENSYLFDSDDWATRSGDHEETLNIWNQVLLPPLDSAS